MTGDRDTLFTGPEVQQLVDRERGRWAVALMVAIPLSAVVGFWAGTWFVSNLYGS